jgi:glycosyltransferase involved in cell wall biosynthesis
MHVLVIHNHYLVRGGESEVFENEVALLRQNSQDVTTYTRHNQQISDIPPWRAAVRTVWSSEDYRALRRLIREQRPDVVHIHNSFPLISPSVIHAAKAEGLPVVQTLHNFRLFCANALLFRDGQVCEECLRRSLPWPALAHACYRADRMATLAVVLMTAVHRILRTYTRKVDVYIALTGFARQKAIQGGLLPQKVVVKPNFVSPDPGLGRGDGAYMLFVGRLSAEKGIATLLNAWVGLSGRVPLKIVGDGPMADEVREAADRLVGVEWLGRQPRERVLALMKGAQGLLLPSLSYEGFPKVMVEAYSVGLPVIGSDLGSLSCLIMPGRTGLHVSPGNAKDLAAQVERLANRPAELAQMRQGARQEFESKYTAQRNHEMLIDIYRSVGAR